MCHCHRLSTTTQIENHCCLCMHIFSQLAFGNNAIYTA